MPKRVAKQLLYGLLYVGFWTAVCSFVYFAWFRSPASCFDNRKNQDETDVDCGGSSCIPCELKHIQPLQSDPVSVFPVGSRVTLAVRVANPNALYGAAQFDYAFEIFDGGGALLKTISGKSFIYGQQFNYLIEPAVEVNPRDIGRVEFSLRNPDWKPQSEFAEPLLSIREQSTRAAGQDLVAAGLLVNNGNLPVATIVMQALFKDANGMVVGASQTIVRDVLPLENRRFEIHHPLLPGIELSRTEIRAPKAAF